MYERNDEWTEEEVFAQECMEVYLDEGGEDLKEVIFVVDLAYKTKEGKMKRYYERGVVSNYLKSQSTTQKDLQKANIEMSAEDILAAIEGGEIVLKHVETSQGKSMCLKVTKYLWKKTYYLFRSKEEEKLLCNILIKNGIYISE